MVVAGRLDRLLRVELGHEEEVARTAETDYVAAGAWAARDHIAHFGLWREVFLEHVRAVLAGGAPEAPPDDLDAANDRQLGLDRQVPLQDLITRWRASWAGLLSWLAACSVAELERSPQWYQAGSVAGAVVRNSYTHPCGHLVDFHFERGRPDRAADLADEVADVVSELSELDFRFPAGVHSFRGIALALRGQPDEAIQAFGRAVALRPVLGPMLHDEVTLASLRGRADFEALTTPH
jgi:hypothetical protein